MIDIRPHRYKQLCHSEKKTNFYLITDCPDLFNIEQDTYYQSFGIIPFSGESLSEILPQCQEPAHLLVIARNYFIESVSEELIGQRKLLIMAANSTPTPPEAIEHFLQALENTDSSAQTQFANVFFSKIENANGLEIVDPNYQVSATFNHWENENNEWFEQGGNLDWGGQQIVPSGEISVLPLAHGKFDPDHKLAINGEIALQGYPILHSGKPSFLATDRARIYQTLSAIAEHAILAEVKDGDIVKLTATDRSVDPAKAMLENMFAIDSRYAQIWELGIGINTNLTIFPGNNAMNEVFGGVNGVVHYGLGLTPFTQYHLDILCPQTQLLTDRGELLIGTPINTKKLQRQQVSTCPCQS